MEHFANQIWFYPALACVLSAALMRPARTLARRIGLMDAPGGRKRHDAEIPLIGGLVLVPVFIVVMAMAGQISTQLISFFAALILLLGVGAIDDATVMMPKFKFIAQFIAALLIVLPGDAQLYHLGNVFGFGDLGLDILSIPFSVIAVVLLINAVNLMDGLDGLASGTVFVMIGALVVSFALVGALPAALPMLIFLGALLGFLFYNLRTPIHKKASIFLGDAGSLCLGLSLSYFAIHAASAPSVQLEPMSVAWILALPIMDTCAQFYRRVREGRHPFDPDRGHFHHHFIDAGYHGGQATARIILLVALLCGFGLFAPVLGVPIVVLTGVWIVSILSHMAISKTPERYVALLKYLP